MKSNSLGPSSVTVAVNSDFVLYRGGMSSRACKGPRPGIAPSPEASPGAAFFPSPSPALEIITLYGPGTRTSSVGIA